MALGLTRPDYLFVPPTQTKGKAYADDRRGGKAWTQTVSATQNMALPRAGA
ncbi:MAG: hypothetical protein ACLS6G_01710 [Christensenellales bacterium]